MTVTEQLTASDLRLLSIISRIRCGLCLGKGTIVDHTSPPGGTSECRDCGGFGIDPDITFTDLTDDFPPAPGALTAADLHELAAYADHEADMLEAIDHRVADGAPGADDLDEATRLRQLADRARRHLGAPEPVRS